VMEFILLINSFHRSFSVPPYLELRDMIVENGGEYHHYWTPKKTRYMVATNLATTKWKALGKNSPNFVVQPKWIVKRFEKVIIILAFGMYFTDLFSYPFQR
jgi:hypothetical protein